MECYADYAYQSKAPDYMGACQFVDKCRGKFNNYL